MPAPEPAENAVPTGPRAVLDAIGERINPVLLRDLRVYAKGRLLLSAYFLTMIVLVLLAILYVVVSRNEGYDGAGLLYILTILLGVTVGALIPNLAYERFRSEFASRATELALMSRLTPARLARGKLMGVWSVSLLVMATAMPIMATAYLLGGVNIISLAGITACLLLAGAVMPTAQLCMAAQKSGRAASRIFSSVVFVAQIACMWSYSAFAHDYFVGNANPRGTWTAALLSMAVGGTLAAQFLYFATVGRLRGEAENRDAAPRLSLAFAAYAGGSTALFVLLHYSAPSSPGGPTVWDFTAASACFVAHAFCLGFLVIARSNPAPPRNPRGKRAGGTPRIPLLLPGTRSLAFYFLLNALVILGFSFSPIIAGQTRSSSLDNQWRLACAAMAPFMFVAIGMNIHRCLVLPFAKEKRNPNLLPTSIVVCNIPVGIAGVFAMILTGFSGGAGTPHLVAVAATPAGLTYGAFLWRHAGEIGVYGLFFLAAQFLLLFIMSAIPRGTAAAAGKDDRRAP